MTTPTMAALLISRKSLKGKIKNRDKRIDKLHEDRRSLNDQLFDVDREIRIERNLQARLKALP